MDDQPPGPLTLPPRQREPVDDDVLAPPARSREVVPPPEPRGSWRSALWLILVLLVLAGVVVWVVLRAGHQTQPAGRFQSSGPMPVGTAKADKGDVPIILSGLGTVTPLAMVTVKTQINGQLIDVVYKEGQLAKQGDLLAQMDPTTHRGVPAPASTHP